MMSGGRVAAGSQAPTEMVINSEMMINSGLDASLGSSS